MHSIDELLEGILVEDVLEREGVDYRHQSGSRGEQLNLRECPFCGGASWKVYINREQGLGNCFHGSCGETFNTYKLTKQLIGADRPGQVAEYLHTLARDLGWRPKRKPVVVETEENEAWELPSNYRLPTEDGANLNYLEERGIDGEIARLFDLRYCYAGWFNYTKPDGSRGGLKFDQRVLIPVYDLDGTMQTFQGRDITGKADRKYLFPTGLPGTSNFLYNGHRAAGKADIVVNEGAFDVIATEMALRTDTAFDKFGVVGTFGIELSKGRSREDQLSRFITLKGKGAKRAYIMWDGEPTAWRKAVEAARLLHGIGLKAHLCTLPPGKDPGSASVKEILDAIRNSVKYKPNYNGAYLLRPPYK